ncbi:MAG TPA: HAD family hydrolase [Thermomicrobiales bacterium]|nr:HAD family hydrolase [Thermomicrobiales bacterium]
MSVRQASPGQALLLFDIDGTLLIAGDRGHGRALLDAFREYFQVEPDTTGISFAGMLDAQITRELLRRHNLNHQSTEERIVDIMNRMGELYEQYLGGRSLVERLLPGAASAVHAAASVGWTTGTLTGNARRVAELKLAAAGLGHLVEIGAFGDTAQDRAHLVEAALVSAEARTGVRYDARQTVLIGDTPRDIAAARHANAGVVAVATGRYDPAVLAELEPDAVLDDLSDTDAFILAVENVLHARLG